MDRARHRRNYDLHSWTGISLGLFVYVVSFTGCIALFYHEIKTWEDPAKRLAIAAEPVAINETFEAWVRANAGDKKIEFLRIDYPSLYEPYYFARLQTLDDLRERRVVSRRWDSATAETLPERGEGLSTWLLDFHRDLMWPKSLGGRTVGRSLVGVAGIILMLSILSGVIAHTKIVRELFSLRYFRSVRLKWQDTHKVLGLWGLPFYTMIAFTGAFLGIIALLAPIVAVLAFKGDQEALFDAVLGKPLEPAGVAARMVSVDELAKLRELGSGRAPALVVMRNWGDENARFDVYFEADTELAQVDGMEISGVTGERIEDSQFDDMTPATRVTNAISPLHYGTYGGIALKLLYFVLGLSLCVITALGSMMWLERRLYGYEGKRSEAYYRRLSRFTVGVTLGVAVASVALFYLDKLYAGAEEARLVTTGWTYFGVWAAAIVYALCRSNDYRTTRELMTLTGIGLLGLPLLNGLVTGDYFFSSVAAAEAGQAVAAWVDVVFLVAGGLTCATAAALPRNRPAAIAAPTEATHGHPAPAE